jgi:hypothetical protein
LVEKNLLFVMLVIVQKNGGNEEMDVFQIMLQEQLLVLKNQPLMIL